MRYQIAIDKEDLIVLLSYGRVIEISRDMSKIIHTIWDDYQSHMNKDKREYFPALIDSGEYKEPIIEPITAIKETKLDKEPDGKTLGKLFSL